MKKEEYKSMLNDLAERYDLAKKKLAKEFAFSNNTYKDGDTVTDHIGALIINKVRYTFSLSAEPQCVYFGIELKKDGTPVKKQTNRGVYQENIIK